MAQRTRSRRGNSLVEFTLLGIPVVFITMSVVYVSLDMWEFQSLSTAAGLTARYASLHGATCAQNGNSCTITLGAVATYFSQMGMALDAGKVNVTFTDGSGSTSCAPLNSCTSSTAQFPSASYNAVGQDVKIVATYVLLNPLAMFWPPDWDASHNFTVAATSRQRILF